MFQNFLKWVVSLFYTAAPQAAYLAGFYISRNNKDKVAEVLPMAKESLAAAEDGQIDNAEFKKLFKDIIARVDDPQLSVLIASIELPTLELGTVDSKAILILEAFIRGCEAGVA